MDGDIKLGNNLLCRVSPTDYAIDQGPEALTFWKELVESDRRLGDLDSNDNLGLLLDNDEQPSALTFPDLNGRQRKFAVHPGFRSYYDPNARISEGISDRGTYKYRVFEFFGALDELLIDHLPCGLDL